MKPVFTAALCAAALWTSGCATIIRGSNDTVQISSSPTGADVKLSNGMTGRTPVAFKLPRSIPVVVEFKRVGYEDTSVSIVPKFSGAGGVGMAGNVVAGGIIGIAVDSVSGAMYDLYPNPLHVTLVRNTVE